MKEEKSHLSDEQFESLCESLRKSRSGEKISVNKQALINIMVDYGELCRINERRKIHKVPDDVRVKVSMEDLI